MSNGYTVCINAQDDQLYCYQQQAGTPVLPMVSSVEKILYGNGYGINDDSCHISIMNAKILKCRKEELKCPH